MPANITTALADGQFGPSPADNGMIRERVKLTGAATGVNDTGTYDTKYVTRPQRALCPGFAHSISGRTITFTALHALGTNDAYVDVEGYA